MWRPRNAAKNIKPVEQLVILPLEKKRCPEDIVAVAIEVLSHYDPRVTLRFTHLVAKAGVELQNISE